MLLQSSLRDQHEKLATESELCNDDASTAVLQAEIKYLRKRLQRAEIERKILKKPRCILRGIHIEIRMGQATS